MRFERWLLAPVAPDAPVDPLAVYATSGAEGRESSSWRAYWAVPDDDLEIAAIGAAVVLRPLSGTRAAERFGDVARQLAALDAQVTGPGTASLAGVVALGGFDFTCEPSGDASGAAGEQSSLTPGGPGSDHLIVPELLVVRRGPQAFAVGLARSRDAHDAALAAACEMQHDGALTAPCQWPAADGSAGSWATDDDYLALVAGALAAIDDGVLAKVVTARSYEHATSSSPAQLLARLRAEAAAGVHAARAHEAGAPVHRPSLFCFTAGAQSFIGASPEVLARFDGERVATCALAGSRPRTGEPKLDAALRRELLASDKERAEHDLVVRAITASLAGAGVSVSPVAAPEVMALARIQHLHTPVSGTVPQRAGAQRSGVLDLVAALHPTPAVGGHPLAAALEWLRDNEPIDRGWFCGPVGWTTPDGIGEFRVGLRCARMAERADGNFDMTLFAGGGVVAGAEPETELAETATKLTTLLAVAPAARTQAATP